MSSCVRVNCIDSFILPSPAQGPSGIPTTAPRPGLEQCQVNSHQVLEVASGRSRLYIIDSADCSDTFMFEHIMKDRKWCSEALTDQSKI